MGGRVLRGPKVEARLYTWDPDRSSLRWDGPVYTDDGEPVTVYNGWDLEPSVQLNLMQERKGRLTDVLYFLGLKLFVSERAAEVMLANRPRGVTVHRLNLRHRDGTLLREYFWLNVHTLVELLDRERSAFREWEVGRGISHIDRLHLLEENIPDEDLFVFRETAQVVFSSRLVSAVTSARLTGIKFEPIGEGYRFP
jgi:hypothetical protein